MGSSPLTVPCLVSKVVSGEVEVSDVCVGRVQERRHYILLNVYKVWCHMGLDKFCVQLSRCRDTDREIPSMIIKNIRGKMSTFLHNSLSRTQGVK